MPACPDDTKLTKIETLRCALSYIKCLQERKEKMDRDEVMYQPNQQIYQPGHGPLFHASNSGVAGGMRQIVTSQGSIVMPDGQYGVTSQSAQYPLDHLQRNVTQQSCHDVNDMGAIADVLPQELNDDDIRDCLIDFQQSLMTQPACDVNAIATITYEYEHQNSNGTCFTQQTLPAMALPNSTATALGPPTPPFSCSSPLMTTINHFSFPQPPTPSDSGDSPYSSPQKYSGFSSHPCAPRPPIFNNSATPYYALK